MGSPLESDNETWQHGGHETPSIQFFPAEHPLLAPNMSLTADGKRKRVGFTQDTTPPSLDNNASSPSQLQNIYIAESPEAVTPPNNTFQRPHDPKASSSSDNQLLGLRRNDISDAELSKSVHAFFGQPYIPKPKPAIRKVVRTPDAEAVDVDEAGIDGEGNQKFRSGIEAHDRAQKLAAR